MVIDIHRSGLEVDQIMLVWIWTDLTNQAQPDPTLHMQLILQPSGKSQDHLMSALFGLNSGTTGTCKIKRQLN